MLEGNRQLTLNEILARLEDRIRLPDAWGDFFAETGPLPPKPDERRRFVRHRFRTKAVLELRQSLPAVPREQPFHCVYMRDVSRSGCSFVHHGQLFPGERVTLWFAQKSVHATVVRCQRHNERCYVIGAAINVAKSES